MKTFEDANDIILTALDNALKLNKFRTFANIFRATIDSTFSADMNRESMRGMTFSEWAGYMISDNNWNNHIHYCELEEELNQFYQLSLEKGLLSESLK